MQLMKKVKTQGHRRGRYVRCFAYVALETTTFTWLPVGVSDSTERGANYFEVAWCVRLKHVISRLWVQLQLIEALYQLAAVHCLPTGKPCCIPPRWTQPSIPTGQIDRVPRYAMACCGEQLAQSCYWTADRPALEPATYDGESDALYHWARKPTKSAIECNIREINVRGGIIRKQRTVLLQAVTQIVSL